MRIRIESLRVWLLGSAILLVLVLAGFIGTAHYLRRHYLSGLPAKLAAGIESGALEYTDEHSNGSTTTYAIHASRYEIHKDGTITLHDASAMLYGAKGDRRDRVYGDEFEYDKKAGVVRATGLVHMDLEAAPPASGGQSGAKGGVSSPRVLHVTTSGLVYMEKLGVAATSEPIEFQAGGLIGHAIGADYASDTGMLTLHSAVSMSGVTGGRPVELRAATAELDDRNHEVFLTSAKYESLGRRAEANQATVYTRPDGTLARVKAQGNVTMQANGATVVAQRADIGLNAEGQVQSAVLTEGVTYAMNGPLRQVRGRADAATIDFDGQAKPQAKHAVFIGAVNGTERTRATTNAREPWSTRELIAAKVVAVLEPAGQGRSELRDVEATGDPHITFVNNGSLASSSGVGTTELAGDDLKVHLRAAADAKAPPQVETIVARGQTVLRQFTARGVEQTTTGDTLDARFRQALAIAGKSEPQSAQSQRQIAGNALESAVQQGHVTMVRRASARSGAQGGAKAAAHAGPQANVEHASAARAAYDGDLDRVTLTGGVEVKDSGSEMWANQVAFDRATDDSYAAGAVKVDYIPPASSPSGAGQASESEPVHILAARAESVHATDVTMFYGNPVRLWQGGSQVQAPAVELDGAQQRLIARGEGSTGWSAAAGKPQVWTVLVRDGNEASSVGAAKAGMAAATCETPASKRAGAGAVAAKSRSEDVVTIASGGLIYSGILRQAEFTGGIQANTVDGTIRANQATVYLQPTAGKTQAGSAGTRTGGASAALGPSIGGDLDRVVATGQVAFDQPGLHATGERLLYTASDRVFLLTGDSHIPPQAVGPQGTTTGAALRLQAACGGGDTVEVLGKVPGEAVQRVRTESRVANQGKKEKRRQ